MNDSTTRKIPCLNSNKLILISELKVGDIVKTLDNRLNYIHGKIIQDNQILVHMK